MALIVRVDGTEEEVTVPKDSGSLKFLQDAVGGNIEYVPVVNGDTTSTRGFTALFCDEEGKLKSKPVNEKATAMAGRDGNCDPAIVDPLCGDVIFFADGEVD